jgi:predicted nucleic acid-binding protein
MATVRLDDTVASALSAQAALRGLSLEAYLTQLAKGDPEAIRTNITSEELDREPGTSSGLQPRGYLFGPRLMAILLDTGVLLRVFVPADPHCHAIRQAVQQLHRQNEAIFTACQNIAEFYNVSTRPVTARGGYGLSSQVAGARVRFIERLCHRLVEDEPSYQQWKALLGKYGVSGVAVHDARLVAMMLTYDVRRILTVNDRDFSRYTAEGIEVLSPQTLAV